MPTESTGQSDRPVISRIAVQELFGTYTYDFAVPAGEDTEPHKLLILYGDNGTGKSTILNLIFHLLSAAPKRNHKSFVARTPFRRFEVSFSNGIRVVAERTPGELVGSFKMTISRGDAPVASYEFRAEEDLSISSSTDSEEKEFFDLLSALKGLGVELYLVSDDRKTQSDAFESTDEDVGPDGNEPVYYHDRLGRLRRRYTHEPERDRILRVAIQRTIARVREQALQGSTRAQRDANTIYTEIVRRLARGSQGQNQDKVLPTSELLTTLEALAKRAQDYAIYNLHPALPFERFKGLIDSAPERAQDMISRVLAPYIDGVRTRLDALQTTHEMLDSFVKIINSFYRGKKVHFSLGQGILICSDAGNQLEPQALSSGEKHLMLLLCNILCARDRTCVFIIDEPELSLNIKWQRQFVSTLLKLTDGHPVQFLLATHSIELLTKYRALVIGLNPFGESAAE